MSNEEVKKAMQAIKDYCKGNKTCEDCILAAVCDSGSIYIPCDWEVE